MRCLLSLLILLFGSPVWSACEPWSEALAARDDLIIGSIEIRTANIFATDTDAENRWIHRLANNWHVQTRRQVISDQLLFKSGEIYDRRILQETARNLRNQTYLHRIEIVETVVCGSAVNILVDAQDNWSLSASFSFERAGGFNDYRLELREANLFGTGRDLAWQFSRSVDRDRHVLLYQDKQFLQSEKRFSVRLEDNSDGGGYRFRLQNPFVSFNDPYAWDLIASSGKSAKSMFENGSPVRTLKLDSQYLYASRGLSQGRIGNSVTRYTYGWVYDKRDVFETSDNSNNIRSFSYPFVGWEFNEDRYVQKRNLTVMGAVEDVSLGHQFAASLGWSTEAAGSTDNGLLFNGRYSKGFQPTDSILARVIVGFNALATNDGLSHGSFSAQTQWRYFLSRRQQFYAQADMQLLDNPYIDEQLVVGGDTGLRGYPLKIQSGDRRYRFTAEYRLFADWYPWRLFRIGAAVFADTGAAWYSDRGHADSLSDVGTGLRIVSARQANNKVLHIDLAFPLDQREDISGVQFVVKTKTEF